MALRSTESVKQGAARDADLRTLVRPDYPPSSAWVSAESGAPAAAALVVDTGALAAGDYRVEYTVGYADTLAAGKAAALEHRDAANAANLHTVVCPAGAVLSDVIERVTLAANERLRVVNRAVAGGVGSVLAASIRVTPL